MSKLPTKGAQIATLVIGGLLLAAVTLSSGESVDSAASRQAKAAEDRKDGSHCLSKLDGRHQEFAGWVQERLGDPSSFEHLETLVSSVSPSGFHNIAMTYRARASSGTVYVGRAIGTYRNISCHATVTKIGKLSDWTGWSWEDWIRRTTETRRTPGST